MVKNKSIISKILIFVGAFAPTTYNVASPVPMEELLCHAGTGRIPVLKYLLLGECGPLWPCLVMPSIKCHCFLWT
jgi:hypothetical protein